MTAIKSEMHIADKTRYANNYDILHAKKIKDICIAINHRTEETN